MELSILGYPGAGKTTLFNALTGARTETAAYAARPTVGVARIPDPRLERLAELFRPQRIVPAEVHYVDIPGRPDGFSISGELLNTVQRADALLHVVRAFEDAAVPVHPQAPSPATAVRNMEAELALEDLAILERRLERMETLSKGAKAVERQVMEQERRLLQRVREGLEQDVPARQQTFEPHERKTMANYQLLTAKPLLVVLNVGEGHASEPVRELLEELRGENRHVAALCGKLEMELAQLPQEEEREFREALGADGMGRAEVIRASHELLGLVSFYTFVSREVRAWSVGSATPAAQAAGVIHSDMERGFIRGEVVAFADLEGCGSLAEARQRGLLRLEGKGYPVQDGDVITFLFNV